jgi:hypothetical protein
MSVLCQDLENIEINNYTGRYNQLPEVEDNDKTMKSNPLAELFLKEISEIIKQYGLEDYIGLRLLHKHFKIESNEVLVEEYREIEGIPSLVTSAQDIHDAIAKKSIPASWMFTEEGLLVFETSTDKEVHNGVALLLKHPEFIEKVSKLINNYQMNNIFALAVLKREALGQTKSDELYFEMNNDQPMSVVQVVQKESIKKDVAIKASYGFGKGLKSIWCHDPRICPYS